MYMHRIPKIDNVYEEFKAWEAKCKFNSNEDLCKDLYNCALIYTDIIFARSSDSKLQSLFKEIQTLNMAVANPFLMTIIRDYKSGNYQLSYDNLIEIIRLCISYVFRRSICGIPIKTTTRNSLLTRSLERLLSQKKSTRLGIEIICLIG